MIALRGKIFDKAILEERERIAEQNKAMAHLWKALTDLGYKGSVYKYDSVDGTRAERDVCVSSLREAMHRKKGMVFIIKLDSDV